MKIKEYGFFLLHLGILLVPSLGSGLDWEQQGEDQWHYDPVISYNAGPTNNNQGYSQQNQNNRGANWNPGDSQQKDSAAWDSGRNQQQNRGWNQQDTQLKDDGRWNNQPDNRNWGPSDTQFKDDSVSNAVGNQRPDQTWTQGGDSQTKDTANWGARGEDSNRMFRPEDTQFKDPGSWSNEGNDISGRNWRENDAQRKDSWNADGRGNWNPDDSQIKDSGNGGGDWNNRDEQVKVTPAWDQGVNQQLPGAVTGAGWTPDDGSNAITGDSLGPSGDSYVPPIDDSIQDSFPNQGQPPLDNSNRPDTSPGIIESNLRGDSGGDYGQNVPENTGGFDGFPANNGRVPQGNYKGGDEGRYAGDDPSQWRLEDSIPGTPGVDYPNYNTIPTTGFDCKQHENPGYYGDVEAQCQVFHICQADGRHDAFLCPLGTIFNQQYFVCVWWFNFNCDDTAMYYGLNADLYKGGHGAQGNFKGDSYPGGTTSGAGGPFTTPTPVDISDNGPGYVGPINRNDLPDQNLRPVGDRGVIGVPGSGDIGQPNPDLGGNYAPDEAVAPIPGSTPGFQRPTERPVISVPGTGPGTGVTSPQGDSNAYGPNTDGKINRNEGKKNWGPDQGSKRNDNRNGNWNNRGVKGGDWGESNSNQKSRLWNGAENEFGSSLEKRWGSDIDDSVRESWNDQRESSAVQEPVWLNRAYVSDVDEPVWNNNQPEYDDVLGAGTALVSRESPQSREWRLENEVSDVSKEKTTSSLERELEDLSKETDFSRRKKKTDNTNTNEKKKAALKNNTNKWWRDAKMFLEKTDKVSHNSSYTKPREEPILDSTDSSLGDVNVYFDLNRDYTSDKSAKQRIWTLL
ncbi:uncharacterized transmembrane protein DDB_G0289901 [Parasteatoda tepidariorum]|nr:uncharacterized protein LOC107456761 [Parasteatoda tepidariorum]